VKKERVERGNVLYKWCSQAEIQKQTKKLRTHIRISKNPNIYHMGRKLYAFKRKNRPRVLMFASKKIAHALFFSS
jgi:hypothetical protein